MAAAGWGERCPATVLLCRTSSKASLTATANSSPEAPSSRGLASTQPPPIERDQPLPMPLRSRLVVAPALREGEAMMDAGIEFDLAAGACSLKQCAQLLDHRQRRERVVLGARDVEFSLDLSQREMWAFLRIADEPSAVKRGCGSDALGIAPPRRPSHRGHSCNSRDTRLAPALPRSAGR